MKAIAIILIQLYRAVISPLFPPVCRFQPTCSQYAVEAIERFGVAQGSWLAARRIVRCNPLFPGGYDPMPLRPGFPVTSDSGEALPPTDGR